MFKSPRRNGRNKNLKIKHVVQISLLLGVSIWLLYQIHHSDDKKVPSVTTKVSGTLNNDSSSELSTLGRKVLRPKLKEAEEGRHLPDDEQKNGNEGLEYVVEDHESDEHEEVGGSEHADGKEDSEEINEHEVNGRVEMKESEEVKERVNGDTSITQNQVVVMEDVESDKMMENREDESGEDHTRRDERLNVDYNKYNSKKKTAERINSAPDSFAYETKTASYMKSVGNDKGMKAGGESEQKDDASLLEEEKDALTDLELLSESGSGGSITHENAATE